MISDYTQHPRAHSSILIIAKKKKTQKRIVGHNITFYGNTLEIQRPKRLTIPR